MTDKEISQLKDMIGFIQFGIKNKDKLSFKSILTTLGHDIRGLSEIDDYFLPRTSGYGKELDEIS